jgi:CubicO group peptidase (beta-lactamase class C family)
MKEWTRFLLIGTCIALCISCTEKKKDTSAFFTRLDSLLSKEWNGENPGGAVLVVQSGQVVFSKGFGLADLNSKEPITQKTLFNLGSISKTFIANGILLLANEGKLSVEDSLIKYFPGFKNKAIGSKIKIKHLLTHTSGLPDNRNVNTDTVFYLSAKDAENWAPELLVDSLEFEPGTNYTYSNPAFNGLALIIEKVSGEKWQDFIKKRIFEPAGMANSTITDGPHPAQGVSHGYVKVHGQWTEDDYGEEPTFAAAGNGGVWSSLEELHLYEKALRSFRLLDSAALADSQTAKNNFPVQTLSSLEDQTWNIGWSWFIGQTGKGVKLVGHSGTQGGFHCNYISIPEKEILFVMLSNFPCERQQISSWVLTNLEKESWLE